MPVSSLLQTKHKFVSESRVVALHGNGLMNISSSSSEDILQSVSPKKQFLYTNSVDAINSKSVEISEEEQKSITGEPGSDSAAERKDSASRRSGSPEAPFNTGFINGSLGNNGSSAKVTIAFSHACSFYF